VRWPDATKAKTEATAAVNHLAYLAGTLKDPGSDHRTTRLADHALDAGWTQEEHLAAGP